MSTKLSFGEQSISDKFLLTEEEVIHVAANFGTNLWYSTSQWKKETTDYVAFNSSCSRATFSRSCAACSRLRSNKACCFAISSFMSANI